MSRLVEFLRHRGARVLTGYLLLVPPFQGGGESSAGLVGIHTAILLLLAVSAGAARNGRRLGPAGIGLALATAWSGIAFLPVDYRYGSFVSLFDLVLFFLLFRWCLRREGPAGETTWTDRLVVLSGALQALVALIGFAAEPAARATGGFGNPNHLAAFLAWGFWAAAARARRAPGRWERAAAAGAGLAILAAILSTGSRGAIAALLAVLAGAVAFAWRRTGGRVRAAAGLLVLLGILAAAGLVHRFHAGSDPYAFARLRIWRAAARVVLDHPVLGVGPGMLESRAFAYNPPEADAPVRFSKRFLSAHNSYLQVAAETGVPGLAFALGAAGIALAGLFAAARSRPEGSEHGWPALALLTLIVHGLVEDLVGIPALTLAVLIPAGLRLRSAPEPRPTGLRERGGPAAGGGGAIRVAAFLYVWWVLVWSPFFADRHFHAMRRAATGEEFQDRFRLARLRNPFQPYYLSEAADRVQRGTADLDPESFAVCHGWLRTAIRLEPGEPGFHRDLARLHVRAFRERFHDTFTRDRAIEAYAETFRLNPTDPRPLLERARFERLVGRPEDALEVLGLALRVEPAYSAARMERLEILLDLGRTGEFRRERDGFDRTLRDLADAYPRNGYEESILALDRAGWDRLQRVELPDSDPP